MKVCEHEDMRCPYCWSKEEPAKVEPDFAQSGIPTHKVTCRTCGGIFWVTCED